MVGLVVFVLLQAGEALNSWQIAFCVLGVVVGALLFVAPFMVEFYLKQRLHEAAESESIETILRRINVAVGEVMEIHRNQKGDTTKLEHTLAAYEGLAGILDQKAGKLQDQSDSLAALERAHRQLAESMSRLEETLDSSSSINPEEWDPIIKRAVNALPEPDFQQAVEAWKSVYKEDFQRLESSVRNVETTLDLLQRQWEAQAARSPDAGIPPVESPSEPASTEPPESPIPEKQNIPDGGNSSKPESEPEEEQGDLLPAERRMLGKAMGSSSSKQEGQATPVKKIIESAGFHRDDPPVAELPEDSSPDSSPDQGSAVQESEATVQPATLDANILIGIGNKLYLRGEGGGLSWDQGQPLEFVEIGLYRWVSEPSAESIQAQLYLNDEISALGAGIVLRPGETLEVTPEFPE